MVTHVTAEEETLPARQLEPGCVSGDVSQCPGVALDTVHGLVGVAVARVPGEQSERMIDVEMKTASQVCITCHQDSEKSICSTQQYLILLKISRQST